MTLKYLIQKEFIQIRRNSFLPKLIVVFPIMIMCVMPWVMQMEVKNIVVDVVDIDHTVESQRLIQQIAASNYFIFNGQKANYDEALKDVEKGRADVILRFVMASTSSLLMLSMVPRALWALPISRRSSVGQQTPERVHLHYITRGRTINSS